MDSSNEIRQIKELPDFHLWDLAAMVNYSEFYEDTKIKITVADNSYELQDYYCKNPDCDCTNTRFGVKQYGEEIGEIWYDYEKGELINPSDYGYLIAETKAFAKLAALDFNEIISARHTIIKNTFEIFKLKTERRQLKKEVSSLKKKIHQSKKQVEKIGRNEPCPCGSGKKYKKCCL